MSQEPALYQPSSSSVSYPRAIALVVLGSSLFAMGLNLFIVPVGLYNGGFVGVAQIVRTLLQNQGVTFGFDFAGLINFLFNIPLFLLAYRHLSKRFMLLTGLSILVQTLVFSLIPIPANPILVDPLAACVVGGIVCGLGVGMLLLAKASGGGTDIIGILLSKRNPDASVGLVYLVFNLFVYAGCAVLFDFQIAVYSIIFAAVYSFVMDRVHLQNIEMGVMIFTKNNQVKDMILHDFVRGVTYWEGMGAYTDTQTEVLMTVVSKYEVNRIKRAIHALDPSAFIIITEGLKVSGGYEKRLV